MKETRLFNTCMVILVYCGEKARQANITVTIEIYNQVVFWHK